MIADSPSDRHALRVFVWVAAAIIAAGALNQALASLIDQSLILWFPAGLALAAMVIAGRPAALGVAFGTFFLDLTTQLFLSPPASAFQAFLLPAATAFSATLQPLLAIWLLKRFRAFPYRPIGFRSLALFCVLAGVLAILAGVAVQTGAFYLLGRIGPADALWVAVMALRAEALGVIALAPALIIAFRAPPGRRIKTAAPAFVAAILALSAASAVFSVSLKREWRTQIVQAEELAGTLAGRVETTLKLGANAIGGVAGVFETSKDRSLEDFNAVAQRLIAFDLGIQAIEWVPRVPAADRRDYEKAMARQWSRDFKIFERRDGAVTLAGERPAYFPAGYVYPLKDNESALGFDLASNAERQAAMQAAVQTGAATATAGVPLAQNGKMGILLFQPAFAGANEKAGENLRGFALGVFAVPTMLEGALAGRERLNFNYWIVDRTDPAKSVTLDASTDEKPEFYQRARVLPHHFVLRTPELGAQQDVDFAGRRWRLLLAPQQPVRDRRALQNAVFGLSSGLLLACLLCGGAILAADHQNQFVADQEKALEDQKFALDQHAIVSISDPHGVIQYVNDRFCRVTGYERQDLLGANHKILQSGVHRSVFYRSLWTTVLMGKVWRGNICNRNASGELFWLQTTIVPLKAPNGRIKQFISISTDITKNKRLEENLRSSEQRLNFALSASSTGLWDYDPNSDRAYYSDTCFTMLGYAAGELPPTGATALSLLHPDDKKQFFAAFDAHRRGESAIIEVDCRVLGKSGGWFWIKTVGKAIKRDRNGAPLRLIGVHIDVTKAREIQADLAAARDAADSANRAKSDFLATMSHEIRTPMNGVIGTVSLLEDTALSPEQKRYVQIILQSGEALVELIDDILDFSKLEAGRLEIERRELSPLHLLDNVFEILEPTATRQKLRMEMDILGDPPARVFGDPTRLRQILLNLAGNAIKFTHQGRVMIRLIGLAPDRLRFEVHDTGIGVAADKRDRLFQLFSQVDASITRKFGGTGLGLAICKRMIEAMGGQIGCDSVEGQGSVFWFETPVEPVVAAPRPEPRRAALVCADAQGRESAEHVLAWCGFKLVDPAKAPIVFVEAARAGDFAADTAQKVILFGAADGFGAETAFAKLPGAVALGGALTPGRIERALKTIDQAAAVGATPLEAAAPLQRSLHILIAEDTPTNQEVLGGLLRRLGHRVAIAENGRQAVERVEQESFDLIFMDVRMPEMDGLEATRRIRAMPPDKAAIRIVAMTASVLTDDVDACRAAGMDDYVSKPVNRRKLAAALELAVNAIAPAAV